MLQVTKIFRFEMAHAIHGYEGACCHLHGHSYELQVTVKQSRSGSGYITPPGFVLDFKVLKGLVQTHVVSLLDHRLVLSKSYLQRHPFLQNAPNLYVWEAEPTAENLLVFVQQQLAPHLPAQVRLASLKLYETADSFAEWINEEVTYNQS
ncbi:MAG: 6-pyruvoyl trahydropterin synthase family protein [Chitinophagaceae bacterium]